MERERQRDGEREREGEREGEGKGTREGGVGAGWRQERRPGGGRESGLREG